MTTRVLNVDSCTIYLVLQRPLYDSMYNDLKTSILNDTFMATTTKSTLNILQNSATTRVICNSDRK